MYALQKRKRRKLGLVMTSVTSDISDTSSHVENMTLDQRSSLSSSSLGSFCIQSLEASRDWFSDEEASLCSSSMKGSFVDRVQVYLENMNDAENFQEFHCGGTVSEDQNYLGLEKTNQQKMQMPKSVSNPLKASSGIPCPTESRYDPTKASTSIPCPLESRANASEMSSGIPHPPQSKDDPSRSSTSFPCLPQSRANALGASFGIPCPPESRNDSFRATTSIPCPPLSRASTSIPCPSESRDNPSGASPSIPCLPQPGSNASTVASDISCLLQSSETSMDSPISEPK